MGGGPPTVLGNLRGTLDLGDYNPVDKLCMNRSLQLHVNIYDR
jgi:hypothetical protein